MSTPARQLKYRKNSTHRVAIDYPVKEYERIKAYADREGVPVNTFIRQAVRDRIAEIYEAGEA